MKEIFSNLIFTIMWVKKDLLTSFKFDHK